LKEANPNYLSGGGVEGCGKSGHVLRGKKKKSNPPSQRRAGRRRQINENQKKKKPRSKEEGVVPDIFEKGKGGGLFVKSRKRKKSEARGATMREEKSEGGRALVPSGH